MPDSGFTPAQHELRRRAREVRDAAIQPFSRAGASTDRSRPES